MNSPLALASGKPLDILTFGEIMLRLSPPGKERISQCETFEKHAGGSEFNVAAGIAALGLKAGFMTRLPKNEIGKFIKNKIRMNGVDDRFLIYDVSPEARLGIYYYEYGAAPRKPTACYDRRDSSIAKISLSDIPEEAYDSTRLFHVSGISLALCENAREVVATMVKKFKEHGAAVSFDVNYRANLWDEETARACIESLLPYIDILFVSEETSRRMLGRTGSLESIMKGYCADYGTRIVATTMRTVLSPTCHSFTSKIYSAAENRFYEEEGYEGIEVVDRIGSGDAYLSGALSSILKGESLQHAVEHGNAMSVLKNTVPGDVSICDEKELENIIKAHKKIGPVSELNR